MKKSLSLTRVQTVTILLITVLLMHVTTMSAKFEAIKQAIERGNLELVRKYFKKGMVGTFKQTPLHLAVMENKFEITKYLVEKEENINAIDGAECTPLLYAARNGQLKIAKFLIAHHAKINVKMNGLWSALHIASFNGHLAMVKYLLNNGVNPTEKDADKKISREYSKHKDITTCLKLAENFYQALATNQPFDVFVKECFGLEIDFSKKWPQIKEYNYFIGNLLHLGTKKFADSFYDWADARGLNYWWPHGKEEMYIGLFERSHGEKKALWQEIATRYSPTDGSETSVWLRRRLKKNLPNRCVINRSNYKKYDLTIFCN